MTEIVEIGASIVGEGIKLSAESFTRRHKLILLTVSMVSLALFYGVSKLFKIPAYPHFSASLFQQPMTYATLLVVAVIYLASVLACSTLAGRVRFDAGLFCTSIGLYVLSFRGGPVRFALFNSSGAGVFLSLFFEMLFLAALVVAGSMLLQLLASRHLLSREKPIETEIDHSGPISQQILGMATNAIMICIFLLVLGQSDRKAQIVCALVAACTVGAGVGYYVAPAPRAAWFWSAPLLVGALGYVLTYLNAGAGWTTGEVRGAFAPLARAMPLDYASIGVASSIFGYWISRQWAHEHEQDSIDDDAADAK
jgi:hypothetical protein